MSGVEKIHASLWGNALPPIFLFCFPCEVFPWEGTSELIILSSHLCPPSERTRRSLSCQFH